MQAAIKQQDNTVDSGIPWDLYSSGRDKFTYGELTDWRALLLMVQRHSSEAMRKHLIGLDIGAGRGRISEWFEYFPGTLELIGVEEHGKRFEELQKTFAECKDLTYAIQGDFLTLKELPRPVTFALCIEA